MNFLTFSIFLFFCISSLNAFRKFSDDPYELQQMIKDDEVPTISPKDFDPAPQVVEKKKVNPEDIEPNTEDENMQDVIEDLTDNTRFLQPLTVQEKNMMTTRAKRRQQFRDDLDQNVEETLKSIKEETDNEEAKRQEKIFERNLRMGSNPMTGLSNTPTTADLSSAMNHFDDEYKFMQMP